MNWPLPSFSASSDLGKLWLEEYIGHDSKFLDIGENIRLNPYIVTFENKTYLTIGASDIIGPALNPQWKS